MQPMQRQLDIAVACGGSGGHTFPGIATASELARRGHRVTLWLAGQQVEADSAAGWDGAVVRIPARGVTRGGLAVLSVLASFWRAYRLSVAAMRAQPPAVLLAMGSYSSVGPVLAARRLGIPVVLHEANAVPGRAIALLSRVATHIGINFESARSHFPGRVVTRTGFPVRAELQARVASFRATPQPFSILVMGGSQGAQVLNELLPAAIAGLLQAGVSVHVTHLAGPARDAAVRQAYAEAGVGELVRVHGFCAEMAALYREADLLIARAGAATCAEIAVQGVPALLIPYPHAARDHQALNARDLVAAGAVDMCDQNELNLDWLISYIESIASDGERRQNQSTALLASAMPDAASRLAEVVVGCAHN